MAYQSFVKNPKFLIESFIDATKNPYSYLMMDFTQKTPLWRRLRSKIFPMELDDEAPILYLPNDEDFDLQQFPSRTAQKRKANTDLQMNTSKKSKFH